MRKYGFEHPKADRQGQPFTTVIFPANKFDSPRFHDSRYFMLDCQNIENSRHRGAFLNPRCQLFLTYKHH
jgi:hypothetical protein